MRLTALTTTSEKRHHINRIGPYIMGLCFSMFSCWSLAQNDQNDLQSVQSLIEQTKAQLEQKMEDSERLQQELKLAELQIAESATLLNATDKNLANTRREIQDLESEKRASETKIKNQQRSLSKQIKSAYIAGNYDFAKMIFNQDDAGKFERTLTYYQYLNKARLEQITEFRALIEQLEGVQKELSVKEEQQIQLVSRQQEQASRLREQQQGRLITLQRLDAQIKSDQERVTQLTEQEQRLMRAIEQAEIAAQRDAALGQQAAIALEGLSQLKGQLLVPASGKVNRLFGKRRQGQVRWQGITISSPAGTPVNSVANGKVLYADWLKGFGLVTIIDHGEGYMSVYGRNQALLKNVGDTVGAGETISLVGNSGGQAEPALYFEVRHKGKALNPSQWLARG